jgi:hypothetical protein
MRSKNFTTVALEFQKHGEGSQDYKFAMNETILKLQGALDDTGTNIQLVVAMIRRSSNNKKGNVINLAKAGSHSL